eukprot:364651-Chlamydomonas_euryale.AAC.9
MGTSPRMHAPRPFIHCPTPSSAAASPSPRPHKDRLSLYIVSGRRTRRASETAQERWLAGTWVPPAFPASAIVEWAGSGWRKRSAWS